MGTIVTYTASLRTRRTDYTVNSKNSQACQEYYNNTYNYVGIVHFPGMNLTNKVITALIFDITSEKAGYGASSTKTVYWRKSAYQEASREGVTGADYVGAALGTIQGSFYGNLTSHSITGDLLTAMGNYIAQGNNTFVIYNPSPEQSSQGYSKNYLMWNDVTLTVNYEEAVSSPTLSSDTAEMDTNVTIYTNRQSTGTTHTINYVFGNASGTIATNVGDSVTWKAPMSLAYEIPNATSGICTITCNSFYGGVLTGSRTCSLTVTLPDWVTPFISDITVTDSETTVAQKIGNYVRSLSKPSVEITATGRYMSTITSYRATLDGVTYNTASFTASKYLSMFGVMTLTVTVTDSRGRTFTDTRSLSVLDYSYPSIRLFAADRCNAEGTEAKRDSVNVRYQFVGSISSLDNANETEYYIYYKLATASTWTLAESSTTAGQYNISVLNHVLSQTFSTLYSYDIKVRLKDSFSYVEQSVSIGTKQVIMDILADGQGIAFGKIAENSGYVDFGWPLKLSSPLSIESGGTGGTTAALARYYLGAVSKTGDTMTGNLNIQSYLYPSLYLVPYYNNTTNRTVFEGSYLCASSFASWEDSSGTNRRMLEIRTKKYEASLDNAVLLRAAEEGTWSTFRVFHSGMASPVPVANGGTGASDAYNARINLGCNNANNLTTGTVAMNRMPFKVYYGTVSISSSISVYVDYSGAGFTGYPYVLATYSTYYANWTGDGGAIKVYSKTMQGCYITIGGNFTTERYVDWIAFGV